MKIVVGLGNVGTQYARTRHNVGWLVLDELARRHAPAGQGWRKDTHAELIELRLGTEKVLLVRPQTMMNLSGRAVQPLLSYYRLEPDALLVVQDDLDSPFGLLRLRRGGRHGGQNGLRDIIARLGTEAFDRLKIGISRPPAGRSPADWVLSRWADDEQATLQQLVTLGASAAETWAMHGLQEAQGRYNSTDLRPEPIKPAPIKPEPIKPVLRGEVTPEAEQVQSEDRAAKGDG
ncbi:aminoacyl-tRNA hydrolase [Deinococcus sp.]|uniref:aminoacyl-tRNA hydrolase n=1 Tax=Deinococcus sp. TaxID=47478 RepID=UPI00286DD5C3|nr:aminoacyl-tRNA hydrolase [Deinococcus sp.]